MHRSYPNFTPLCPGRVRSHCWHARRSGSILGISARRADELSEDTSLNASSSKYWLYFLEVNIVVSLGRK